MKQQVKSDMAVETLPDRIADVEALEEILSRDGTLQAYGARQDQIVR